MEIITLDLRTIKCKFIDIFQPSEQFKIPKNELENLINFYDLNDEDITIRIVLHDDSEQYETMKNISHINN